MPSRKPATVSIGSSSLWRATRDHPAVTAHDEIHRYLPLATARDAEAA
jgi:hypothetical protein